MSASRPENALRRCREGLGWTWQAWALLALIVCLPGCLQRGVHTISWGTTLPRRSGTIAVRECHGTPDPWAHGRTVWRPLDSGCTAWRQPVDGAVETDVSNAEDAPALAPQTKALRNSNPSSLLPGYEGGLFPEIDEPDPLPGVVPAEPIERSIPMPGASAPAEQPLPAGDHVRRLSKPPS
ncbi:MAG: hypothetical protein HQ567_22600 [Candidatus Nealsonbacteria bacterium]|nr:hypothetical protein [Candidatus Nealsonbacteria bacterium]